MSETDDTDRPAKSGDDWRAMPWHDWYAALHGVPTDRARCGTGWPILAVGMPLPEVACRPRITVLADAVPADPLGPRYDWANEWATVAGPGAFDRPPDDTTGIGHDCIWWASAQTTRPNCLAVRDTPLRFLLAVAGRRPCVLALVADPPDDNSPVWGAVEQAAAEGIVPVGGPGWGARRDRRTAVVVAEPCPLVGGVPMSWGPVTVQRTIGSVGALVEHADPVTMRRDAVLRVSALAAQAMIEVMAVPGSADTLTDRTGEYLRGMSRLEELRKRGAPVPEDLPPMPHCGHPRPLPSPLGEAARARLARLNPDGSAHRSPFPPAADGAGRAAG